MPKLKEPTVAREQFSLPQPLAVPGEIVELRPLGSAFDSHPNALLVDTSQVKIVQLIIPAGVSIPTHEAQGEIIFHCLEGRAWLTALQVSHELIAGQLLYLHLDEPFSIQGIEQTSLLVTIISAWSGAEVKLIGGKGETTTPKSQ